MRNRILGLLTTIALRAPRLVLAIGIILAIVSGLLAWSRLDVNSDPNALIDADRPYMQKYAAFLDIFGELEHILIVIDANDDHAAARACVVHVAEQVQHVDGVDAVYATIEPEEQLRYAWHRMTEDERAAFIEQCIALSSIEAPTTSTALVERAAALLVDTPNGVPRIGEARALLGWYISAVVDGQQIIPLPQREFLTSSSGDLYFIRVDATSDYSTLESLAGPLASMRSIIEVQRSSFPSVEIGLTGKPVLQDDELRASTRDMTRASVLAIVLVTILFMVMFKGIVRPLWAVGALLLGMAWTIGVTTVVVGHLNLLSMVFTLVLVGVGIDFGVHSISRYAEFRTQHDRARAIRRAMLTAGRGNITGAATSAMAFFGTMLGDFRGLRELGLIAGIGLLLCLLAMLTILPAGLAVHDQRTSVASRDRSIIGRTRVPKRRTQIIALCAMALLTLALIPSLRRLHFETNLLKLQPTGLESVEWQQRMIDDDANSIWFGAIIADDLEALDRIVADASTMSSVSEVRSVQRFAPRSGADASGVLNVLLTMPEVQSDDAQWPTDETWMGVLEGLDRAAEMDLPGQDTMASSLESLRQGITFARSAPERGRTPAMITEALRDELDRARLILDGSMRSWRDALPAIARSLYVSDDGRLLAMVHPRGDIWDVEQLEHFVADLEAIDADATGVPMTHLASLHDMRAAFSRAILFAAAFVVLFIGLDFRSIRYTLLSLIPTALGMVWLLEAMSLLGVSFNLANFFAIPILIGIGVDNGVHVVHRRREGGGRSEVLGSTGRAILTTSLTTTLGFGTLLLASHRGLQSLGAVLVIGSLATMCGAVLVLPMLLGTFRPREMQR
ncbi:MAG: MMPL family transporter [Planctomycetota bacterium]